jgi:hypothetical protein
MYSTKTKKQKRKNLHRKQESSGGIEQLDVDLIENLLDDP